MTAGGASPPRLGSTHVTVLESINQHRLLSTRQIHFLHTPHASRRWASAVLANMREAGWIDAVRSPGGLALWFLTERGADAVEVIPSRSETRRKVYRRADAAGSLQQHTLAVNDVGVAFVRAARQRGDEFEAFSWRHEIAHSLGPPPGRRAHEQLIVDALLSYGHAGADGRVDCFDYRFVELDRCTRAAENLAERLARYGRLYRRRVPPSDHRGPAELLWPKLYPAFPMVLVVLANGRRDRLERRRDLVLALCAGHPELSDNPEVSISMCLLEDLVAHGPFAPICRTRAEPEVPVNWVGERVGS